VYVPNISDILNEPLDETVDKEYYDFWKSFKRKYPGTNNVQFKNLHIKISNDIADNGAHMEINYMTKNEFDKLISIGLQEEYNNDMQLCIDYRDWLF
jgi:hypothetical protein